MLEQLFSSRTRVKLLRKFLLNTESKYYVRELTREIDERINSVRRELENLVGIGFLITFNQEQKKYYQVNKDFLLYPEIEALIIKSQSLIENKIIEKLKDLKQIKYCVFTGKFVRRVDTLTDILVVGDKILFEKFKDILKLLEKNFDQEINYTILTSQEFQTRSQMTDRFIYNILNGPKIVVVDKIFSVKR
jgi:hypothetical protein